MLFESEKLLAEKRLLFQELQHRVGNSFQIITNILLLKARAVSSLETRGHLEDAYERVMSAASVQSPLNQCESIEEIEVKAFLSKLCESLACSMSVEDQPFMISVFADEARMTSSEVVPPANI